MIRIQWETYDAEADEYVLSWTWTPGATPYKTITPKKHHRREYGWGLSRPEWSPRIRGFRRLPRKLKARTRMLRGFEKAAYPPATLQALIPDTRWFALPFSAVNPENGFYAAVWK